MAKSVGFTDFQWYKPIIAREGIQKYGEAFWEGYADDPELGYFVAIKR
jgi:hypothetical protein